jgi:hypothetical protein
MLRPYQGKYGNKKVYYLKNKNKTPKLKLNRQSKAIYKAISKPHKRKCLIYKIIYMLRAHIKTVP